LTYSNTIVRITNNRENTGHHKKNISPNIRYITTHIVFILTIDGNKNIAEKISRTGPYFRGVACKS
jgi:hypothetical protein